MRAINLANDKARNAQVGFEARKNNEKVTLSREDGMGYETARFLKATLQTEAADLLAQFGDTEGMGNAILQGDPEIDIEKIGMRLQTMKRIYLTEDDRIVYRVNQQEIIYGPDNEEKGSRAVENPDANINAEAPLRWSGKLIPKKEAIRKFVFCKKYQVKHVNGLTYDFLYAMAKELAEKDSMMLMGSGTRGMGPIIMSKGGTPYRAFLEGRIEGERYELIMHLSNFELKQLPKTEPQA